MQKSFFDLYEFINSTKKLEEKFIKDPIDKKCRFCQKAYPEVSFETIPHLIPELFGRNNHVSNFECDNCNREFQKHETDTSTLIQHYLALLNLKTKRGVPNFQSLKNQQTQSTTINIVNDQPNIYFGNNLQDFEYDEEEKSLLINLRTRRFRPYSVYKIFLKIAISLMTEQELKENIHYLEFLNAPTPIKNGMQQWDVFSYRLKTKMHPKPTVNLYKAKETLIDNKAYPEHVLLVNVASLIYQFFLPISKKNMDEHQPKNRLILDMFPSFILDGTRIIKFDDYRKMDLSETELVSITDDLKLYYERKDSTHKN